MFYRFGCIKSVQLSRW